MATSMATRNVKRITFTEAQLRHILQNEIDLISGGIPTVEQEDIARSIVAKVGPVIAGLEYGVPVSYTKVPPKPSTLESLGGSEPELTEEEEEAWGKEVHENAMRLQQELDDAKRNPGDC
jgi:hypothetical protein